MAQGLGNPKTLLYIVSQYTKIVNDYGIFTPAAPYFSHCSLGIPDCRTIESIVPIGMLLPPWLGTTTKYLPFFVCFIY